jgi:hypothetical protein
VNGQLEEMVKKHIIEGAVMSGKLAKQGSVVSGNKNERWCVLDARQLSLYEDQKENLAKTIIPLKDVESIESDPSWSKYGFKIQLKAGAPNQKTDCFRFDADNTKSHDLWVGNLTKLHASNAALAEDWDKIRQNYLADIKVEKDRHMCLQTEFTTYKIDATAKAEDHLSKLSEQYSALLKQQGKIDDDLWMWVERHMWQMTSAQGIGFGAHKQAQALGGAGLPCNIETEWTDQNGASKRNAIDVACHAASDGKAKTYTVNFEAPVFTEDLVAHVRIQRQEIVTAPPVPVKDPKDEVKKLQRLMVLRNPSPPRSRQRGAGDHSASPRGKSPPKRRTPIGSVSNSPRPSPK